MRRMLNVFAAMLLFVASTTASMAREGLQGFNESQHIVTATAAPGPAITLGARFAAIIDAYADYGVRADGTDQTAHLQAAIAAAQAGSAFATGAKALLLPAGKIITGPLTIAAPINISGQGDESTEIVLKNGATSALVTIQTAGVGPPGGAPDDRIYMRNLRLTNQTVKTGDANAHGLQLVDGLYRVAVFLENVQIYAMPGDGIKSASFTGGIVGSNLTITNNAGQGIDSNSDNDWHLYGGTISVSGGTGLLISGATQFVIDGTNIFSNLVNVDLFSSVGSVTGNIIFNNVMMDRAKRQGLIYDLRGLNGAQFRGTTHILAGQEAHAFYPDVEITSGANNLAYFDGAFWGNNTTELYALKFDGAGNTVTMTGTNQFSGGTLNTNAINQVVMANPANPVISTPGELTIHQPTTPTVGSGAGDCGTSPTIVGNDVLGRVTVGSSTNGGKCTLTFAGSPGWVNAPVCRVDNETSNGNGGVQFLFSNGTSVGNGADTTQDTLHSFTLPAGKLANIGDTIHLKTGGTLGATTDSKTERVSIGGQVVSSGVFNSAGITNWWSDVVLTKTGSNTQSYVSTMLGLGGVTKVLSGTLTLTDTSALAVLVTGQNGTNSVAGSITAQLTTIDYERLARGVFPVPTTTTLAITANSTLTAGDVLSYSCLGYK